MTYQISVSFAPNNEVTIRFIDFTTTVTKSATFNTFEFNSVMFNECDVIIHHLTPLPYRNEFQEARQHWRARNFHFNSSGLSSSKGKTTIVASTLVFANNAGSTLAGSISNTALSLNLQAGGGALFPNPTTGQIFVLTAIDAATGLLREIMWCTARSADTLTVVRAQEGTVALSWNAGDLIQELWTAGQAAAMVQVGQAGTVFVPTHHSGYGLVR